MDSLLVSRGLAPTRTQAVALVLSGKVSSGGVRLDKPGSRHPPDVALEIEEGRRFVSRGGYKLEAALARFAVDPAGRDVLDVGASTGGFTQALLERGAARIIALDVGRGQLDWRLRNDPRVFPLEGFNARYLSAEHLPFEPQLAVVDVSFISLERILPALCPCIAADGDVIALVKPQFEVGRGKVGRGGLVRSPALRHEVLARILAFARIRGWGVEGLCASVLRGATGNQEYFIHLRPSTAGMGDASLDDRLREALSEVRLDSETHQNRDPSPGGPVPPPERRR